MLSILVLVSGLFLSACSNTPTNITTISSPSTANLALSPDVTPQTTTQAASGLPQAEWSKATFTSIQRGRGTDKLFVDFGQILQPDLAATYYAEQFRLETSGQPQKVDQTAQWVQQQRSPDGSYQSPQKNPLFATYYAVSILDALGQYQIKFNNTTTTAFIQNLQQADGSFRATSPDGQSQAESGTSSVPVPAGNSPTQQARTDLTTRIGATQQALQILKLLGSQPKDQSGVQKWLLQAWQSELLFQAGSIAPLSRVDSLVKSLGLSGLELKNLPLASDRRDWLEQSISKALSINAADGWLGLLEAHSALNLAQAFNLPVSLSDAQKSNLNSSVQLVTKPTTTPSTAASQSANPSQFNTQTAYLLASIYKQSNLAVPTELGIGIAQLQSPYGGYVPVYTNSSAGTRYTYFALSSLKILGQAPSPSDKADLTAGLKARIQSLFGPSLKDKTDELYYALASLELLDEPMQSVLSAPQQQVLDQLWGESLAKAGDLQQVSTLYYLNSSFKLTGRTVSAADYSQIANKLKPLQNAEGSFGQGATAQKIQASWLVYKLAQTLTTGPAASKAIPSFDTVKLVDWVRGSQLKDGSFGEGSTGYLIITKPAFDILTGEKVAAAQPLASTKEWLSKFRSEAGGYKIEQNSPYSDLYSTYQGLALEQVESV